MDPQYQSSILELLRREGVVALADKFEVGRYLSKLGTLDSDAELLRFVAPLLTEADVLTLHAYLKKYRDESEWREQFEAIFAGHVDALPELEPL